MSMRVTYDNTIKANQVGYIVHLRVGEEKIGSQPQKID